MNNSLLKWLGGLAAVMALLVWPGFIQAQGGDAQIYVVQLNDSLWKLAEKYLGDGNRYPLIIEATAVQAAIDPSFTPIVDPMLLHPGQKLWIPAASANAPAQVDRAPAAQVSSQPGGHIAFSFWNSNPARCTYEINIISVTACLQSPAQCQATRRIVSLNNISEPALSPDGARLAFRGWGAPPGDDSPFAKCAPAHPTRGVGSVTLDGQNFVRLSQFWEDAHPAWSPDGNKLLFDSGRNGDHITRLLLVNADGTTEEELRLAGQQPAWAPDNQRFVYRGCDLTGNRCGLWLAVARPVKSWEAGQNMLGPVVEDNQASHPAWSPVADELVYQSSMSGRWGLYLVNSNGTARRLLTTAAGVVGLPAWSPDGQWLAYVAYEGAAWSLRLVNRDGAGDRLLFTYDGGLYALPVVAEPYGARDWLDEQISWSR